MCTSGGGCDGGDREGEVSWDAGVIFPLADEHLSSPHTSSEGDSASGFQSMSSGLDGCFSLFEHLTCKHYKAESVKQSRSSPGEALLEYLSLVMADNKNQHEGSLIIWQNVSTQKQNAFWSSPGKPDGTFLKSDLPNFYLNLGSSFKKTWKVIQQTLSITFKSDESDVLLTAEQASYNTNIPINARCDIRCMSRRHCELQFPAVFQ